MTRRPRVATLVALGLVAVAFAGLVWTSLTNAVVYYVTPTEIKSLPIGSPTRLYGLVASGSVRWDAPSQRLSFVVTDGTQAIDVATGSIPTGLFREGVGVVLAGRMVAPGRFDADELLVKHSEVYAPLAPGETVPPGLIEMLGIEAAEP